MDPDAAWERFKQLRQKQDRGELPARATVIPLNRSRWLSIAATLVIILGLAMLYRMVGKKEEPPIQIAMLQINSGGNAITDTLPDGTILTLNKNSRLDYPEVFSDTLREVSMQGEVFFEVAKNPAKPFIIHTGTADIKVLGTSFNIKTRHNRTEVIVETGLVEVSYNKRRVELTTGKMVTVQQGDSVLVAENTSGSLYKYFRNKQFVCDNTKLSDVAAVLGEAFSVQFVIEDPTVQNMRITTVFSDEPLDNILTIIEETMGLNAQRQGDTVRIQLSKN